MNSFIDVKATLARQPARMGVSFAACDRGRGREDLFSQQLPDLLTGLAESTRVASIRASVAIEGYEVPVARARALATPGPGPRVRNRNEREFAGYRDAIDELMRADPPERIGLPLLLHLHRTLFSHSGGAGGRLKVEDNRIVRYDEDGRMHVIFDAVPHERTEYMLTELIARYHDACERRAAHPLALLGLLVLDLLAIHPVADGNGRLARLVTAGELLRHGYGVARYVSLEQRIFETRSAYYAALQASQERWHEARHDPWPWIGYLVDTLAAAYAAFEERVDEARGGEGLTKQERVRHHVRLMAPGRTFRIAEIRTALPGIADQTLRLALHSLRDAGEIAAVGTGRSASWRRL